MMKETLYDLLKKSEDLADRTNLHFNGVDDVLIGKYQESSVLDDAIDGRVRLEQLYDNLSEVYSGVKKFIPRDKDEDHNKMVDELSELINADHLKTVGMLHPDNPFTCTLYTTFIAAVATYGLSSYIPLPPDAEAVMMVVMTGFLGPFLGILVGGMAGYSQRSPHDRVNPREQARYIDQKVKK